MLAKKKINKSLYKTVLVAVTFLLLLVPILTYAQFEFGGKEVLTFSISPAQPRSYQDVTVSIESFLIDLERVDDIMWLLNDKIVARGAGVKEIQFQTGALGSSHVVDVVISGTEIGTVEGSKIIKPADVDILWQANTYTHPLYSGKALPTSDAEITFVAVPQFISSGGKSFLPSELIFTWKKDGRILGEQSGRGKDTLVIKGPKYTITDKIQVEVSSIANDLMAKSTLNILSVLPKIVFYENDPILGMKFENAIQSTTELVNEEVTITANPYFFSTKERTSPDIRYTWRVRGSRVNSVTGDESSLILRQVSEIGGEAGVSLDIQHLSKLLQSASANFSLIYSGVGKNAPFVF